MTVAVSFGSDTRTTLKGNIELILTDAEGRGQSAICAMMAVFAVRCKRARAPLRFRTFSRISLVMQQGKHVISLKLGAAFESVQFDHKSQAADIGAK